MEGTLARMCPTKPVCGAPARGACAGMCARLRRSLYGTRDAAARWEAFLSKQLESMGFARGLASPCCYRHCSKRFFARVESDFEWVRQQIWKSFLVQAPVCLVCVSSLENSSDRALLQPPRSVGGRYACTCSLAQTGSRTYVARVDFPCSLAPRPL